VRAACRADQDQGTVITALAFIEEGRLAPVVSQMKATSARLSRGRARTSVFADRMRGLTAAVTPWWRANSRRFPAAILFTSGSEERTKGVVLVPPQHPGQRGQAEARIDFGRSRKVVNRPYGFEITKEADVTIRRLARRAARVSWRVGPADEERRRERRARGHGPLC